MKKSILSILILIIITGIFSPLSITLASVQDPDEYCDSTENPANEPCVQPYKLLAPLPGLDNTEDFYPSDPGALGKYLNILIELVIGISAVLAVVMIVMGGIEYMGSELISSKEEGKSKIQNALFGLLIAICAWALLNTINPDLLKSNDVKKVEVTIEIGDSVPQTAVNGKYSDGRSDGATIGSPTTLPSFVTLAGGPGYECKTVGQQHCTSTFRLLIAPLNAIHNGCNCNFEITGGTETWLHGGGGHGTTHGVGSGTVDIRSSNNPDINKYFTGGKLPPENKWYKTPAGYALYEGDHWHFNPLGEH